MAENKTSLAASALAVALEVNLNYFHAIKSDLPAILEKYKRMEEALQQITEQSFTIHSAEAIADDALAFDPLSL